MLEDNYEVLYIHPDNLKFVKIWLQEQLDRNLELVSFSEGYWVFRKVYPMVSEESKIGFVRDALDSYAEFYKEVICALGFPQTDMHSTSLDENMLERISDLIWLSRHMTNAVEVLYKKLPSHWREDLPFSYFELMKRAKSILGSNHANHQNPE